MLMPTEGEPLLTAREAEIRAQETRLAERVRELEMTLVRWSPLIQAAGAYVAAWKEREEFEGDENSEEYEGIAAMPYECGEDLKAAARGVFGPDAGAGEKTDG